MRIVSLGIEGVADKVGYKPPFKGVADMVGAGAGRGMWARAEPPPPKPLVWLLWDGAAAASIARLREVALCASWYKRVLGDMEMSWISEGGDIL